MFESSDFGRMLIFGWFSICIFVILSFFLYKFIKFHKESKFAVKISGSEYEFSAKVLLEEKHRDLSYNFMNTLNAFRKLVELKHGGRINIHNSVMRSLSNFTDGRKLNSLLTIFQIYKEVKKSDVSESFLVDFCKTKLERFNSSFSVSENYLDTYLYSYDNIVAFLRLFEWNSIGNDFPKFLIDNIPELHSKIELLEEFVKEGPVASRHHSLLEKLLSFEKVKDVPVNVKTFWEKLVLNCGRSFSEGLEEDVQNEISKRLVSILISQKFGFLDGLSNFEEIGKITRKHVLPYHVLELNVLNKNKVTVFL